ncbi:hypothetical protein BDY24DRAFT_442097 [Mrakia frigida]|uniref:cytochrome and DOMON domain-containing protein n=1 Tax=Mrakia frigida TaxID=29902 RepID=UPI003FCBFFE0
MHPLHFLSLLLAFISLSAAQSTGDSFCSSLVCVSAVKTSSKVTYTLSRPSASQDSDPGFGWIAIGFGSAMANSPMVIAWPNSDNSITLSQRSASSRTQPTVTSSPSSVATLETAQSLVDSSNSTISFSFDDTSAAAAVSLIWAYSATNPSSSSASANLMQHRDAGTFSLDLSKALDGATPTSTGTATATSGPQSTQPSSSEPYTELQRVLIAHAAFGGLGTMIFIPLGVVIARLLRTFWPRWIVAHWVVHVVLSLPFIIIAFALGIRATNLTYGPEASHFFSDHRRMGLVLFLLLFLQVIFGSVIHWTPASHRSKGVFKGKSIQNLLHPLLGVAILAVGWATCWLGFDEWELFSGLGPVSRGVRIGWVVLLGIFALVYLGGLALLPRQFALKPDRQLRHQDSKEQYSLRERPSPPATS